MNPRALLVPSALTLAWCLAGPAARADWISLSGAENAANIAEFRVGADGVRVTLEVFVGDIVTFDRLIPDEYLPGLELERPSVDVRMREFSQEDLRIVTDEGEQLVARLETFEPRLRTEIPSPYAGKLNPFTGTIIPGPPADKRVFYVELVYPFSKRPRSLTFVPPTDEKGLGRVPIGFITYHEHVPVNEYRYLGTPSTLNLDWEDPWYSAFEAKALKRWQRGGVMSFLYVEHLEVRHEILARVREFEAWMDLGLRGEEYIEPDENEPLKARIGEFFLERDNVTIDGERLSPVLDRTAFVKYAMTGSTFLVQPERIPIDTAMVGVIITYPTDAIPQEVRMEWGLWSDRIQVVPTDAIDPAGPFPSEVTPDDNVHVWKNYLKTYRPPSVVALRMDDSLTTMKVPLASVLCFVALLPLGWFLVRRRKQAAASGFPMALGAGLVVAGILLRPYFRVTVARPVAFAATVSDEEAVAVLDSLLRNTYRSFDFRKEEEVYDRLAMSVTGDLLSEVYLENRRSLAVTQAGGAQARVQAVEILDSEVERLGSLGMRYRAKWTAEGSVNHWGHLHTRKNLYEAEIDVEPVEDVWKITGLEILDESRIDAFAPTATGGGR